MHNTPGVAITAMDEYTRDAAMAALREVLAPFGGLEWVKPGMRIAIKVNLVTAKKPEAAATTHPVLVAALCEMLCARGASVVVGDSPGGLFTGAFLAPVYRVCGLHAVEEAGARLNDDFREAEVDCPDALRMKSMTCTHYLVDADAVIDFCKLKTHSLMAYTGACKNMFGAIPGLKKTEYHYLYPETESFAEMLIDIYERIAPRICIEDAVMAMEGNGPTMGTPRKIGALIASPSAHALDLVGAALIGLGANEVPTLAAAQRHGRIPATADELEIFGDWKRFIVNDFECLPVRPVTDFSNGSPGLSRLLEKLLADKPHVNRSLCVGCAICEKRCPAKAITMVKKKPEIDRGKCIRCFCCQEFCEKAAMRVRRPALAKLLYR